MDTSPCGEAKEFITAADEERRSAWSLSLSWFAIIFLFANKDILFTTNNT